MCSLWWSRIILGRIMTVGVDSDLYGIPRCEDGHRSRCRLEVSGGACEIQVMVEIVVDDLEFHKSKVVCWF
jgi:hypothetical protein